MSTPSIIGIAGGVGPMAGVLMHRSIIENTVTVCGTDQGHFPVIHVSFSGRVGDRSAYLLQTAERPDDDDDDVSGHDRQGGRRGAEDGQLVNPGAAMADALFAVHAAAESTGEVAVVGVPCNTFHAPAIWDGLVSRLTEMGAYGRTIKLVHMLHEMPAVLDELGARRVGVLSTTGTRNLGLYEDVLLGQTMGINRKGGGPRGSTTYAPLEVLQVPPEVQAEVHETIYDKSLGLKAHSSPPTDWAVERFQGFATDLVAAGADAIVLGCTEIPLALPGAHWRSVPLVGPIVASCSGVRRYR